MNIKKLYDDGVNIIEYFRNKENSKDNSLSAILTSYDLQAGSYIKAIEEDSICNKYYIDYIQTPISVKAYVKKFCKFVADEINQFDYNNILEAGVGEATSLKFISQNLKNKDAKLYGFDLAPSRILEGKKYLNDDNINADLFVGNLLETPFEDNSFDIIYTVHALEPNTNRCKEIVSELLRITNGYLILIEPSWELGNQATKENIEKHRYIKNLKNIVEEIGIGKIIKYELCPIGTYTNQPAIMIIKKNDNYKSKKDLTFACPICHKPLIYDNNHYFCDECFVVYPVIKDIPMLTKENAVLFTKYLT